MTSDTHALEGLARMRSMQLDTGNEHFIVLSQLNRWLEEVALPHARGVLLDFGCGGQPYKALFNTRITRYIGADVAASKEVQLDLKLVPGEPVQMPAASVDTILSTQTLEHVFDVGGYAHECYRLLKPGGTLILSVPMQWRLHEIPYDYWRFTRYGVTELMTRSGLVVDSITPCGGMWAVVGQIINSHLAVHRRGNKLIYRCINRLALWLDRRFPDPEETLLWMCLCRKPDVTSPHAEGIASDNFETRK